jgi:hypothetical protein
MAFSFNCIDWPQIKDAITSVGTVGALVIGIFGLTTWRRQLRGTSEYEVARRAVLHTYQVSDALQAVRNPLIFLRKEDVEGGRQVEAEMRIYNDRMKVLQERWAELRTVFLEARVIWGGPVNACFKPIETLIRELRAAIWEHFWLKGAYAGPSVTVDNNPARVAGNDKVVYLMSDEDEFSQKIDAAVHGVEAFFERRIRR